MADEFTWDIVVRLAAIGAKSAGADVKQLTSAVDEMGRTGKVSEKALDSFSQKVSRMGDGAGAAAKNLPRLRYALFDVSSTLAITGAAMVGVSVAAAGMAISMDRAFADVIRTTESFGAAAGEAAGLRDEFEQLFTTMPTSWADLTNIGALAGQLNIARDSVAEFTELVAMFAATTDVSVEQAATAFGRLSQLLDVPSDELQNLGSSILAVGVNSIATESQIIAISTQITSMASTAGFTADEVFGLSAALASLGTQPELSRGVITRLFTNITVAINEGGDRLEAFGRIAGTTGDQFAKSWGDNASQALLGLVQGLGTLDQTKAVETLNELGITAARDVPTILRLAQNSEVLAESLQVAAQGYADGTALQEQYSVITSTVAEKLNILVNNFQNLIATAGEAAGGLGFVVDAAIALTRAFTEMIDNPVGATILGVVVAVTALTGIISLLGALVARGVAGMIAFRTVTAELAASGFSASAGLSAMTASLTGVTASSTAATTATRALGIAFKSLPIIGLVLVGASIAFDVLGESMKTASDRAEDFFGSLSGFNEAIAADTKIFQETGQAISTFEGNLESATTSTDTSGESVKTWLGIQQTVPGAVDTATESVSGQTLALGENAEAWIRNALASNDAIKQLANSPEMLETLKQVGFNIDEFLAAGLSGGTALDEYIGGIRAKIAELGTSGAFGTSEEEIARVADLTNTLEQLTAGTDNLLTSARETANVNELLGISATEAADGMGDLSSASFEALDGLFEIERAALSLQSSIFGLGSSLAENGTAFDYFSEAGRANMGALLEVMDSIAAQTPGDAAATASALQGLFNFIVQGGYASAEQLGVLSNAIATLSGGAKVVPAAFDASSFFGGWSSGAEKAAKSTRSAGSAARNAAKEVRTLVDYGNDLEKVFSRAFDLQFSGSSTLDAITTSFSDMRDAIEESARNVAKLKAEIQGLQSDLNIQQIFLGVALEYGDTARAEAIQANIAKLQADLADKTANLSDEQENNSKALTGNSKAAIANRSQMEALVKQYQDHLVALASSGLGQAELAARSQQLRAEFIQQATQLGYSRAEVDKYAQAFDSLTTIINRVPRNITVNANADPALQALNEFIAKAKSTIGSGLSVPIGASFNDGSLKKQARAQEILAQINQLQGRQFQAIQQGSLASGQQFMNEIRALRDILNSGNYSSGGYTGPGGKYEAAGVVHRGEYVVPKKDVNQRTGLPYADAMGRLQRGASGPGYAGGGFVRGGSGLSGVMQMGSLGPMAQQQFNQMFAENLRVYLDGQRVAENSSRQYAHQTAVGGN